MGFDQVATDLAVTAKGEVILRLYNPQAEGGDSVSLYRWSPNREPTLLVNLGKPELAETRYGLQLTPDGGLLIAGGNLRGIWRLSPEGAVDWKTVRQKSAPPGYSDLRCPLGITMDKASCIWVTDPTRHQILHLDERGKLLGALGCFGDGSDGRRLSLNQPLGIATLTDRAGTEWLYVADTGNNRILKWPLP